MSDTAVMPSWRVRPPERARGLPGSPKVWAIAGGVILGATVLGAGAWWWLGEGAGRGVPLVKAESAPFRVRPDDPGGMRVANQGSEVFDRNSVAAGARPGEARLGAAPEVPRPDALRSSQQPPPVPATAAAPPPAAPPPATGGAANRAGAPPTPPPAAPAQSAAAAPPRPAAAPPGASVLQAPPVPPPVAPAGAGRSQVQLAATRSEEAAQQEWRRLQARIPELQGRQPVVSRLDRGEGQPPLFRVRAGGFADANAARAFCEQLRAREQGCMVVGG